MDLVGARQAHGRRATGAYTLDYRSPRSRILLAWSVRVWVTQPNPKRVGWFPSQRSGFPDAAEGIQCEIDAALGIGRARLPREEAGDSHESALPQGKVSLARNSRIRHRGSPELQHQVQRAEAERRSENQRRSEEGGNGSVQGGEASAIEDWKIINGQVPRQGNPDLYEPPLQGETPYHERGNADDRPGDVLPHDRGNASENVDGISLPIIEGTSSFRELQEHGLSSPGRSPNALSSAALAALRNGEVYHDRADQVDAEQKLRHELPRQVPATDGGINAAHGVRTPHASPLQDAAHKK